MGKIRIKYELHVCGSIEIECIPNPPQGVTDVKSKQVKGPNMAADVQVTFTPDSDPHVQKSETTFMVGGASVGVVTLGPTGVEADYSQIPGAPTLNVGDMVSGFIVTTDDLGQQSPQIPFPAVTITEAQPPPQGVTNVASKQVGAPDSPGGPHVTPIKKDQPKK